MGNVLKKMNHESLMLILVMFFPLHTFLTAHYLPSITGINNIVFSVWREGIICLLLLKVIADFIVHKRKIKLNVWVGLIFVYIAVGLFVVLLDGAKFVSIYGFRNYFFPFFMLFAFYFLPIKNPVLLLKGIFTATFIVTVFGFIQLYILGPAFLLQFGYGENGFLGMSFYISGSLFQRIAGTFSSPNEFGLYLVMVLLLAIYYYHLTKDKMMRFFIPFELIALIYTISRSSWLAFIFAGIYLVYQLNLFNIKSFNIRKVPKKAWILFILILGVASFAAHNLLLKLYLYAVKTVTLQDPSTIGHIESMTAGISNMINHPLGFGLGRSGPKGVAIGLNMINVENSFLLLVYELGIPGLILFLLVLISTIRKFKENQETKIINTSITIAVLIAFFFLPHIQSLDITYFYWMLVGLFLNKEFSISKFRRTKSYESEV